MILLRQLLWVAPAVLTVLLATFLLLRFAPSGPHQREGELSAVAQQTLDGSQDSGASFLVHFGRYVGRTVQGDFERSSRRPDRSVRQILASTAPVSFQLGLSALILALFGGLFLGGVAAATRGSFWDRAGAVVATLGYSIPAFALATFLILTVCLSLKMLPPALWEGGAHMVLPVITLAAAPGALIARLTRVGLSSVLSSDHVRTARAKGVPELLVVWRHGASSALSKLLGELGPVFASLVAGSVVVEHVFSIPGLGRLFVTSATSGDHTVVAAALVVYATVIVFANVIIEISRAMIEPDRAGTTV